MIIVFCYFMNLFILFFAIIVVIFVSYFLVVRLNFNRTELNHINREKERQKRNIALLREKFLANKLTNQVFQELLEESQKQLILLEIQELSLKGKLGIESKNSTEIMQQVKQLKGLTKRQVHAIEKLLKGIDSLQDELSLIQEKFVFKEISKQLFEKLSKEKNAQLLEQESLLKQFLEAENQEIEKNIVEKTISEKEKKLKKSSAKARK